MAKKQSLKSKLLNPPKVWVQPTRYQENQRRRKQIERGTLKINDKSNG